MIGRLFRGKDCRFSLSWKVSSPGPREKSLFCPRFWFCHLFTDTFIKGQSIFCALDLVKLSVHYLMWSLLQWLQAPWEMRAGNGQRGASVGSPQTEQLSCFPTVRAWCLETRPGQMQDPRLVPPSMPQKVGERARNRPRNSLATVGLSKPWLVLFHRVPTKFLLAQEILWSHRGGRLDGPVEWEKAWATGFIRWDNRAAGGHSQGLVSQAPLVLNTWEKEDRWGPSSPWPHAI